MSLAAKLPYDHAFAGGFSGIGSQPLPTDSDCLTYLAAVASADGAGVETSVAVAVDAFFRAVKDAGIYSDLKACCILAGARTITGALVPLAGTAPTSNGFVSGDYSRTDGITGDGTSYLDSNRANDADPQNDQHIAVWISTLPTGTSALAGSRANAGGVGVGETGGSQLIYTTDPSLTFRIHTADTTGGAFASAATGFFGATRTASDETIARNGGADVSSSVTSETPNADDIHVFQRSGPTGNVPTDATLSFYSVGTDIGSAGLAALDTAVSNLITAIGNAL